MHFELLLNQFDVQGRFKGAFPRHQQRRSAFSSAEAFASANPTIAPSDGCLGGAMTNLANSTELGSSR
eukprot:1499664-Amphidinium_carterae.1